MHGGWTNLFRQFFAASSSIQTFERRRRPLIRIRPLGNRAITQCMRVFQFSRFSVVIDNEAIEYHRFRFEARSSSG